MSSQAFKVFSPAKINLFLFIGNKRKDNYHNIYSLMVPLKELGDILEFKPKTFSHLSVRLKCSSHFKKQDIPSEKKNIVWKAASLFYEEIHKKPKMDITIHKKIPIGAGLGGGSSNAATTLLALNAFHQFPFTQKKLLFLASQLGSDVPFFIYKKPSLVKGRGEKIKPISFHFKHPVLILYPHFPISTSWAYTQWDEAHCSLTKKPWNVKNYTFFLTKRFWSNDFEKVVFPQYPMLKKIKEKLVQSGALYASLSGSGSCIFGIFKTKKALQKAINQFSQKEQSWILQK